MTVLGRECLEKVEDAYVVVANHTSHLDTPLIMGALPRRLARYLAVGAAADYFFDVWRRRGLTALFFNAFPVDRTGASARRVSARALLNRGVPLLIFPEGTRSRDGSLGVFKPGAAALASSAEVPVLPVAVIGAYAAHPADRIGRNRAACRSGWSSANRSRPFPESRWTSSPHASARRSSA